MLACLPDDPGRDDAVAAMKAAGARSVELVDFDAVDTESHPKVIEQCFADGDIDVAIVAFGLLGTPKSCGRTSARRCRSPRSTTPRRFRWACCWPRKCAPRASARSSQ
ncbi:putative decaprenylphosphoryl-D-2-keto erythropentose reductase [Mycobacterium kansasii]|uniref:Putative decaprenylphosphoryl-D-2-keto erythropentose reductase n=1 Tax=Mycobacterium kansasii TaxID=1768 RepID=A0A1V3XBW0_MYCKA|nr:putative decaprenylphosphoryl-D-2-keto erythropentose reductase [Mycobacterium kansasii]